MRHYEIVFMVHPDQSEQVPGMAAIDLLLPQAISPSMPTTHVGAIRHM